MRKLVIATIVLLLSVVSVCLLMMKLHAQEPTSEVTWQQLESAQIQLGVRDKYGELDGYTADFVVIGPNKQKYHVYKKVEGDDFAVVYYPEDFQGSSQSGKYTWKCLVNGKPVIEGKFRFTNSGIEIGR